jgi:FkbM family methyltransferase
MKVRPAPVAAALKRLLGVTRINLPTPHGTFAIDPVSLLGIALSRTGEYEAGMRKTLETHLKPGSSFVDLGANEGYFTVIAGLLCGHGGRVLSIEPQERLLPVIRQNILLNRLSNVSLLNAAISDTPGSAELFLTSDTNSGGSGFHRHSKYSLPTQTVQTLTLEQALDQHQLPQVDLMKIDIEGFEYEALLGSPQVFQTHRIKALALELHPHILEARGKDANEITAMLANAGYTRSENFGNDVWTAP